MTPEQIDGITKARLVANVAARAQTYATDADYIAHVCAQAGLAELPVEAAQSYADQWSGESIAGLELQLANVVSGEADAPAAPAEPAPVHDVLMGPDGLVIGDYDGTPLADGQWVRKSDAPNEMLPLAFLDLLGPENYAAINFVAEKSPAIQYLVARGLAARSIVITESFPALVQMERAGIIPAGTAVRIWS